MDSNSFCLCVSHDPNPLKEAKSKKKNQIRRNPIRMRMKRFRGFAIISFRLLLSSLVGAVVWLLNFFNRSERASIFLCRKQIQRIQSLLLSSIPFNLLFISYIHPFSTNLSKLSCSISVSIKEDQNQTLPKFCCDLITSSSITSIHLSNCFRFSFVSYHVPFRFLYKTNKNIFFIFVIFLFVCLFFFSPFLI